MIMWFGDAYIKLTASGALEINAPSGTKIIAPSNDYTGNISSSGTVTNNGKNIGSTHTHGGVSTGGSNTGAVT